MTVGCQDPIYTYIYIERVNEERREEYGNLSLVGETVH